MKFQNRLSSGMLTITAKSIFCSYLRWIFFEKWILSLIIFLMYFVSIAYGQNFVDISRGASLQSLRNDDKNGIYISGCENDLLKMDDINNLHGDNWTFYFVGTVSGISDIKTKPFCDAPKMSLQKGCGYVARHSDGSREAVYVRIFVVNMLHNKSEEVIGADLLYESPYNSICEIAQKIFWNNYSVPNLEFRKLILKVFDSNNDGKISEEEAAQKKELKVSKGIYDIDGINFLKGLTSLEIEEGYEKENLTFDLPNLHSFTLKGAMSYVKLIDLSGCPNLDTVRIGHLDGTDRVVIKNCKKLKYLDFSTSSEYYTRIYTLLDISGCTALTIIKRANIAMGSKFDASGCVSLMNAPIAFGEMNFSGCTSLPSFYSTYPNSKINFSGCDNISTVYLTNTAVTELDLRDMKRLESLFLDGGKLSKINLGGCSRLSSLTISKTLLKNLDLSACKNLMTVNLDSTDINNLEVSGLKFLDTFRCTRGSVASISFSGCSNLFNVLCYENPHLSSLTVSDCPSIVQVSCNRNILNLFNLSNCDSLQYLDCSDNQMLNYLNLSRYKKLCAINCNNTSIQELDISQSETIEWTSIEGYDLPVSLPGARSGFKTLWVNKNQKIEQTDGKGFILMSDKKIDKLMFLPKKNRSGLSVRPESGDTDFKIRIREF